MQTIRRTLIAGAGVLAAAAAAAVVPNLVTFADPSGAVSTYVENGAVDTNSPFFESLGTNGRSCATCHTLSGAMGLSASGASNTFDATHGHDPLFAGVDGANCPGLPASDRAAHSLIVGHGLFRIALPVPSNAEFTVETVYDPYGCADTSDPATGTRTLSVYRRPLPGTNLRFLSTVMWDGRETVAPLNDAHTFAANLVTDLKHQALDATLGHAQASTPPTDAELTRIVQVEMSLYSAQGWDRIAGPLRANGAAGGPIALSSQRYFPGINDSLGGNPTAAPFSPQVFSVFARWTDVNNREQREAAEQKAAIAAGEEIFNTFPLKIEAVAGLNDTLGQESIGGTCSTCHDTPNVGNHSLPVPLDIGVSHPAAYESDPHTSAALQELSAPDLPVFKVTCTAGDPGRVVYTSDPGRALISGRCADLTRVKGPILRGLAARAPYFHNGAAGTLREVVEFYNQRFSMELSDVQKQELVAFLQAL